MSLFEQVGFEAGYENGQCVIVSDVGGREFQRRGAERLKALESTMVMRAGGIVKLMEDDDLSMWRSSVSYREARLWRALKVNVVCDWEPVKLSENSGDVMDRRCSGDDPDCSILN